MRATGMVAAAVLLLGTTASAQTADVQLTMDVDDAGPSEGERVTFTLTVTNDGPDTTAEVGVAHLLPGGLDFVSATPTNGIYMPSTAQWLLVNLEPGASQTLELVTNVSAVDGSALVHLSQIATSDLPDPDSTPGNGNETEDDWAEASVTVTGSRINQPPIAFDFEIRLRQGDRVPVELLASDDDGDELAYAPTQPTLNALAFVGPGPADYEYQADYPGHDGFNFTVNDGLVDSNVASVTVTVDPVDKPAPGCTCAMESRPPRTVGPGLLALVLAAAALHRRRRRTQRGSTPDTAM